MNRLAALLLATTLAACQPAPPAKPSDNLDSIARDYVDVEAAGANPQARWKRMEAIISEPTLPSDLRPAG